MLEKYESKIYELEKKALLLDEKSIIEIVSLGRVMRQELYRVMSSKKRGGFNAIFTYDYEVAEYLESRAERQRHNQVYQDQKVKELINNSERMLRPNELT